MLLCHFAHHLHLICMILLSIEIIQIIPIHLIKNHISLAHPIGSLHGLGILLDPHGLLKLVSIVTGSHLLVHFVYSGHWTCL